MNIFNQYNNEFSDKITEVYTNQYKDCLSKTNSLGSHTPEHSTYPADNLLILKILL
jgi:hypothetical protein